MNELLDSQNDDFLSENDAPPAVSPPQYKPQIMHPLAVIILCFVLFLVGNIALLALAKLGGVDINQLLTTLGENTPIGGRNMIRSVLFLNHLLGFILPAIFTAILVYKNASINYLQLKKLPDMNTVGLAFLLLVVSVPLVQYSYLINKMIPLPQWMHGLEQDTSKMLVAILTKEYWYEAVLNVLLIGVVPAIGEEMVFRGILQQQLGRIFKNEHVVVWLSAAIFSAIHMQFEGFLARMVLGALLGYLFVWTRNLWVPMIVHLLNNGLQIIFMYAANIKPSEMEKMGGEDKMTWWMALISLGLVIYIAGLIKRHLGNNPARFLETSQD
jgi:uncharacterized protein